MKRLIAGWIVFFAAMSPALFAEEAWAPENWDEIVKAAEKGDAIHQWQIEHIERIAKDHVWRVPCTALELAQFGIAQLEVRASRPEKAVEVLQKLADSARDPDVQSAARYDIGKVYALNRDDVEKAADAFKQVAGMFEPMAKRDLVNLYERAGLGGKAIEFLQTTAPKVQDKGAKLAMLNRLAALCKDAGKTEDALAAYRQIAEEFTPKDLDELKAAATKRVREMQGAVIAFQKQSRWQEAEAAARRPAIWIWQLRAAGREDELKAAIAQAERGWREEDEPKPNEAGRADKGEPGEAPK